MVWFKVDDSFYDHPKVFDAPDCAVALCYFDESLGAPYVTYTNDPNWGYS